MNGIRARRKAERPGEILEAAFQEFVAKGFGATRLEDVAKRAGVTKGTIYLYFESKAVVFERCVQMIAESSAAQFAETEPAWTDDLAADLRAYVGRIYRFIIETPRSAEILRLLVAEANRAPDLVHLYFERFMDPVLERLRERLVAAAASGIIAEPSPMLPEFILSPPLAYLTMMLLFGDRRRYDAAVLCKVHLDLLLAGLMRQAAPVTLQITSPTSSATSSERSGPSVTPTGRP